MEEGKSAYKALQGIKELLDSLKEEHRMDEQEYNEEIIKIITDSEFKMFLQHYPELFEKLSMELQEAIKLEEPKKKKGKATEKNIISATEPFRKLLAGKNGLATVRRGEYIEIFKGELDPLHLAVLEAISAFRLEGKNLNGFPYFTIPELYRKMRHGKGTARPTPKQVEELEKVLSEMGAKEVRYQMGLVVEGWNGSAEDVMGESLISYRYFERTVRGQRARVYVMKDTFGLQLVMEQRGQFESIAQEVKGVMYVAKNGELKPYNMTAGRVRLATVLNQHVIGYIRARTVCRVKSNKLPYQTIFAQCGIDTKSREATKRAKEAIAVILDHLARTVPALESWKEYTNKTSSSPDGIEIKFISEEG